MRPVILKQRITASPLRAPQTPHLCIAWPERADKSHLSKKYLYSMCISLFPALTGRGSDSYQCKRTKHTACAALCLTTANCDHPAPSQASSHPHTPYIFLKRRESKLEPHSKNHHHHQQHIRKRWLPKSILEVKTLGKEKIPFLPSLWINWFCPVL